MKVARATRQFIHYRRSSDALVRYKFESEKQDEICKDAAGRNNAILFVRAFLSRRLLKFRALSGDIRDIREKL